MWRSPATSFVGYQPSGVTDRLLGRTELNDRMRLNNLGSIAASYDIARIGSRALVLVWAHKAAALQQTSGRGGSPKERKGYGADLPRCRHQSNDSNHRGSNESRY